MTRKYLVPIVLPADPAAAMEAATKQYVDGKLGAVPSEVEIATSDPIGANAVAELWYNNSATPTASFVARAGDTMTGKLTLPAANPTVSTDAAHKGYVDGAISAALATYAQGIVYKGTFIAWTAGTALVANTVTNLTTAFSFTTLVGRRYRFVLNLRAISSPSLSRLQAIATGTNPVAAGGADFYALLNGLYSGIHVEAIFDGSGVNQTFGWSVSSPVAAGIWVDLLTSNWYLEDVGTVRP